MWDPNFKKRQSLVTSEGLNQDQYVNRWNFDDLFTLGNKVALTAATNTYTFTKADGAAIPDLRNLLKVGDNISLTTAAATYTDIIVTIPTAASITVAAIGADVGAAAMTKADTFVTPSVAGVRTRLPRMGNRTGAIEVMWQPPLSIFRYDKALPAGKYELQMNPQPSSSWKSLMVESFLAARTSGFDISVVDMYLYVSSVKAKRVSNMTYFIDLDEIKCQSEAVQSGTATSLVHSRYTVPASTYAITAAFQDQLHTSSTLYSSTKFKIRNNDELRLSRMYIEYGGKHRPSPDADPIFKSSNAMPEDYTAQRWYETQLNSGAFMDNGGSETLEEWQDRGPYYHFNWPKDGANTATEAKFHYQFGGASDQVGGVNGLITNTANALLFSHSKKIVQAIIEQDQVISVTVLEG